MMFAEYMYNPKYRVYIISLIIAVIVSVLVTGSFFIYRYYLNKNLEDSTFKFAQITDEYSKSSSLNEFKDLFQIIKSNSKKYKNSKLYPFFLFYQSDLKLKSNNKNKAIKISDNALNLIDKKNPLYYNYAIKNAFLKIDSENKDLIELGYKELKDFSNDIKNPLRDMVTYNLALYNLSKSDKEEAKNLLTNIVLRGQESFWYNMAKERLEYL